MGTLLWLTLNVQPHCWGPQQGDGCLPLVRLCIWVTVSKLAFSLPLWIQNPSNSNYPPKKPKNLTSECGV